MTTKKKPQKNKGVGFNVRHPTARSGIRLVPLLSKPLGRAAGGSFDPICPTCQVFHPVKTLHIWVDDTGKATISQGVLDLLQAAGMDGFIQDGHTDTPPPLKVGGGITREENDYVNRTQQFYGKEGLILNGKHLV